MRPWAACALSTQWGRRTTGRPDQRGACQEPSPGRLRRLGATRRPLEGGGAPGGQRQGQVGWKPQSANSSCCGSEAMMGTSTLLKKTK